MLNPANIPPALRDVRAWLLWRYVTKPGDQKPRKVPIYVGGGYRKGVQGSPQDREKLASFDDALSVYTKGGFDGLGFAMLPDWGLVGLDFDNCVSADGEIIPEISQLIGCTYAEFSPSGKGVRAFMRGDLYGKKKHSDGTRCGFETFYNNGFLTITGNLTPSCKQHGNDIVPLTRELISYAEERFGSASGPPAPGVSNIAGGENEEELPSIFALPLGLSQDEVRALLKELDPNMGYEEWLHVGMSLHHEGQGGCEMFSLWDEWSSTGATYPGTDQLVKKWNSFGRLGSRKPITARWLRRKVGVKKAGETPILDPKDFISMARKFMDLHYQTDGGYSLVRVGGDWYQHLGPCYVCKADDAVRAQMWIWLDSTLRLRHGKETVEPFKPSKGQVDSALDALKAVTLVEHIDPPAWLKGFDGVAPGELVSLTNGLLHIPTRKLIPHSAGLFTLNTLPYAWEPTGRPTAWLEFLHGVWGDDQESVDTLQEMFGYLLTADTSQQKMFLIRGPKRSGKGTIGRVLTALLGRDNVCSPSLTSLASQFGLQPLIGKLVALIPDARVGGQTNTQAIVERLLMVSGEDSVTVDRKHVEAWSGTLSARFVMLTNETPQLGDASGALASRFVTLYMTRSFFGREDQGLTARLLGELPGIFRWALDGRDRLKQRGYFINPASSADATEELEDVNSPVSAFVKERCDVGPYSCSVSDMYDAWRGWCMDNGIEHVMTRQVFGKKLGAATPVSRSARGAGGREGMVYVGVKLRSERSELA